MIECETLDFLGGHIVVLQRREDSEGGITILEHRLAEGFSPPRHIHYDEEETFVVLEGRLEMMLGNRTCEVAAGRSMRLPAGVEHCFKVVSSGGARTLTITRGGFEAMVRASSQPALPGSVPQLREPTPEAQRRLAEIASLNGIDLVGPPMA